MSKTEEIKQVTKIKNPKRVAAGKKGYEERMLKMKKDIHENAGSNDTNLSSNDGTIDINLSSNDGTNDTNTTTNTTKSNNDVYFYGIGGGLSILAIVFLVYYKFNPQKKSVEVNTKVEEPLVYRSEDVIVQLSIYILK